MSSLVKQSIMLLFFKDHKHFSPQKSPEESDAGKVGS